MQLGRSRRKILIEMCKSVFSTLTFHGFVSRESFLVLSFLLCPSPIVCGLLSFLRSHTRFYSTVTSYTSLSNPPPLPSHIPPYPIHLPSSTLTAPSQPNRSIPFRTRPPHPTRQPSPSHINSASPSPSPSLLITDTRVIADSYHQRCDGSWRNSAGQREQNPNPSDFRPEVLRRAFGR